MHIYILLVFIAMLILPGCSDGRMRDADCLLRRGSMIGEWCLFEKDTRLDERKKNEVAKE
jgi:hypothetical protein